MPAILSQSLEPTGFSITLSNGYVIAYTKAELLALKEQEGTKTKALNFIRNKIIADNPGWDFSGLTIDFNQNDGTPISLVWP
jgi:hypothetical protein